MIFNFIILMKIQITFSLLYLNIFYTNFNLNDDITISLLIFKKTLPIIGFLYKSQNISFNKLNLYFYFIKYFIIIIN